MSSTTRRNGTTNAKEVKYNHGYNDRTHSQEITTFQRKLHESESASTASTSVLSPDEDYTSFQLDENSSGILSTSSSSLSTNMIVSNDYEKNNNKKKKLPSFNLSPLPFVSSSSLSFSRHSFDIPSQIASSIYAYRQNRVESPQINPTATSVSTTALIESTPIKSSFLSSTILFCPCLKEIHSPPTPDYEKECKQQQLITTLREQPVDVVVPKTVQKKKQSSYDMGLLYTAKKQNFSHDNEHQIKTIKKKNTTYNQSQIKTVKKKNTNSDNNNLFDGKHMDQDYEINDFAQVHDFQSLSPVLLQSNVVGKKIDFTSPIHEKSTMSIQKKPSQLFFDDNEYMNDDQTIHTIGTIETMRTNGTLHRRKNSTSIFTVESLAKIFHGDEKSNNCNNYSQHYQPINQQGQQPHDQRRSRSNSLSSHYLAIPDTIRKIHRERDEESLISPLGDEDCEGDSTVSAFQFPDIQQWCHHDRQKNISTYSLIDDLSKYRQVKGIVLPPEPNGVYMPKSTVFEDDCDSNDYNSRFRNDSTLQGWVSFTAGLI